MIFLSSIQDSLRCEVQAYSSVGKGQFLRSWKQTPFRHQFPSPALDLILPHMHF